MSQTKNPLKGEMSTLIASQMNDDEMRCRPSSRCEHYERRSFTFAQTKYAGSITGYPTHTLNFEYTAIHPSWGTIWVDYF
jgi:hypothetical protein